MMRPGLAADSGRRVPRKRLCHLACQPDLRWILGDLEVDDPSAVVAKNDQRVEKPERRGGDDEHVDRGHIVHVVVQEAAPGWGGDLGSPRHVSPNGGLADFNTEHEQFAVNARRPPDGVGHAHLADQLPDLCARLRPTNLARS